MIENLIGSKELLRPNRVETNNSNNPLMNYQVIIYKWGQYLKRNLVTGGDQQFQDNPNQDLEANKVLYS